MLALLQHMMEHDKTFDEKKALRQAPTPRQRSGVGGLCALPSWVIRH
jgi:hypothetical protein